jgi:hypothetical protein
MSNLMMQLPDVVCDARGTFQVRAMARERSDGTWEGWLDFLPVGQDVSVGYATPIETHQHDSMAMERWASGLTRVYSEGALSRARIQRSATPGSELLFALEELVDALDRRIPQVERVGEAEITADANRLRACAIRRIALVTRRGSDRTPIER